MYESLTALKKNLEDAKKQVQEKGKEAIGEAFKELFAAHPALKAVRWTQYTPYFNDGEPCEFGVSDPYISAEWTTAEDADEDESDDDDEDEDGKPVIKMLFEYVNSYGLEGDDKIKKKPIYDAVQGLMGAIPEEAMLASFDDHVRVTATRDGFTVEEYSHD